MEPVSKAHSQVEINALSRLQGGDARGRLYVSLARLGTKAGPLAAVARRIVTGVVQRTVREVMRTLPNTNEARHMYAIQTQLQGIDRNILTIGAAQFEALSHAVEQRHAELYTPPPQQHYQLTPKRVDTSPIRDAGPAPKPDDGIPHAFRNNGEAFRAWMTEVCKSDDADAVINMIEHEGLDLALMSTARYYPRGRGPDLPYADHGRTIAHVAALHGATKILDMVIDKYPQLASQGDWGGNSPALVALNTGKDAVAARLIEASGPKQRYGDAVIKAAAENGCLESLKGLHAMGVNLTIVIHDHFADEETDALSAAATKGHTNVVQWLLEQHPTGWQPYAGYSNSSAFDWASHGGQQDCLGVLLEHRHTLDFPVAGNVAVGVHLLQMHQDAVLAFAAEHFPGVQLDITNPTRFAFSAIQALLSARDGDGNTALHVAARDNKLDIVEVLFALGADPTARAGDGQLPSDLIASENGALKRRFGLEMKREGLLRIKEAHHLTKATYAKTMTDSETTLLRQRLVSLFADNKGLLQLDDTMIAQLRTSFALEAVLTCAGLPETQKKELVQDLLKDAGAWVIVGRNHRGHYHSLLVRNSDAGQLSVVVGDRYFKGQKGGGDQRFDVPTDEGLSYLAGEHTSTSPVEHLASIGRSVGQKISRKWQGSQNNCVTQSLTVTLEALLTEVLQRSKADTYSRIKPLRLRQLTADLRLIGHELTEVDAKTAERARAAGDVAETAAERKKAKLEPRDQEI